MQVNVFLSVGRSFNDEQEAFTRSIETFMAQNGLRTRTVGRNEFTHKSPLHFVDKLMNRCGGALVIALERISVSSGAELGGPPKGQLIQGQCISTPWNQIEAALAYAKNVPLLVIRQNSVRAEGLLEPRYDWYVHSTDLDPAFLNSNEFQGTFTSWKRDVLRRAGWFGCRGD